MKLYELPTEWAALEAEIEEAGGELSPELLERLDAFEADLSRKAEAVCRVILNHDAEAAALQEESRRFAERARVARNTADRLKEYLKRTMEAVGQTKLDAGLFKVAVQRNGQPSVIVDDPTTLPIEFQRLRIEPDRQALLDALKAGATLPAEVLVLHGTHLRIR